MVDDSLLLNEWYVEWARKSRGMRFDFVSRKRSAAIEISNDLQQFCNHHKNTRGRRCAKRVR